MIISSFSKGQFQLETKFNILYSDFLRTAGVFPIPGLQIGSNPNWKMTTIEHTEAAPSSSELKKNTNEVKEVQFS